MRSLRRSSPEATADGSADQPVDRATKRSRRRFARRQWRRRWLAWRYLLVVVLVLGIVGFGIYAVWFSSWLAVDHIEVSGAQTVSESEIRDRSGIDEGEPLIQVDVAGAERRIGSLA
ncbi:MAG TPA: FtsQ-type POTRA domain-containing protein, partial [Nocardioides sp.]|nr:FtsQ-type POTRA domain-containing protein [Nocardioides sp.]